ncbi:hypothetical protein RvY_07362, partial [Ramazzottius varieornatus]
LKPSCGKKLLHWCLARVTTSVEAAFLVALASEVPALTTFYTDSRSSRRYCRTRAWLDSVLTGVTTAIKAALLRTRTSVVTHTSLHACSNTSGCHHRAVSDFLIETATPSGGISRRLLAWCGRLLSYRRRLSVFYDTSLHRGYFHRRNKCEVYYFVDDIPLFGWAVPWWTINTCTRAIQKKFMLDLNYNQHDIGVCTANNSAVLQNFCCGRIYIHSTQRTL